MADTSTKGTKQDNSDLRYIGPNNPFGELTAGSLLKVARDTLDQRAADRDLEQERSMAKIVATFNALHGKSMTEKEGWSFMLILKMARSQNGKFSADDYVDMAAYSALMGECHGNN